MKIAAGIVLFNPDTKKLRAAITAISTQVSDVIIFDNSSIVTRDIKELLSEFNNIRYLREGPNLGIAEALNKITECALSNEFDWLLTLDQDTECPSDIIQKASQYFSLPHTAVLCTQTVDTREPEIFRNLKVSKTSYTEIPFAITAGSFLNLNVFMRIGGFDRELFIEYVDFEYCARARSKGYKTYRINEICINQEFGDLYLSRFCHFYEILARYLGVYFLKHFAFFRRYAPTRRYYSARNMLICHKRYPMYFGGKWSTCKSVVALFTRSVVSDKKKVASTKAIYRGIKDGLSNKS